MVWVAGFVAEINVKGDCDMAELVSSALNGLSESAKEKLALEIKKAVNKQVKKELAKRRKKFARKLIMTGIVFTCGCVLYFGSDKLVDVVSDKLIEAPKKSKSKAKAKK